MQEELRDEQDNNNSDDGEPKCVCFLGHWVKSIRNLFMPKDRNLFSSVTPLEGRMLQLREARYLLASMSLQELQELQLLDPMSPEEFQALHLLSSATRRRENQSSETVLPSDGQTRTLLERSPPESVA